MTAKAARTFVAFALAGLVLGALVGFAPTLHGGNLLHPAVARACVR